MLPKLTFVIAVVALVLALWPVVGDAPWEDGVTEAELSEILQEEAEASAERKEADREAKCDEIQQLVLMDGLSNPVTKNEIRVAIVENKCEKLFRMWVFGK